MTDCEPIADLLAKLQKHAKLIEESVDHCTDEDKTKLYLILPFFDLLGYRGLDIEPEFVADIAGKKGEKVDYALKQNGQPVKLVEAKRYGNALGQNETHQLQRYFPHTPARLGLLTDGVMCKWFKSEPGRDVMEPEPFLTHDLRSPTRRDAESLYFLTKDAFDSEALEIQTKRRILEDQIYEWLRATFVNPSLERMASLNAAANLKVPKKDHHLLRDASVSVFRRVLEECMPSDYVEPQPVQDGSDIEEPFPEPMTSHVPEPGNGSSSKDPPSVALKYVSHDGDTLDLGSGEFLDAAKQRRAWRAGGGEWTTEKNSTSTTTAVLAELLANDARRSDEQALATAFDTLNFFEQPPEDWHQRSIPGFSRLYWGINVNNSTKDEWLTQVVTGLRFDPGPGSLLAENPTIEWWLPPLKKKQEGGITASITLTRSNMSQD